MSNRSSSDPRAFLTRLELASRLVARMLRAIAHSRLAAFAAIGGLLFAVTPRPASTRDVEIDRASLRSLEAAEARRLGAARLSPEEASQVDARAIEDEILYREAL